MIKCSVCLIEKKELNFYKNELKKEIKTCTYCLLKCDHGFYKSNCKVCNNITIITVFCNNCKKNKKSTNFYKQELLKKDKKCITCSKKCIHNTIKTTCKICNINLQEKLYCNNCNTSKFKNLFKKSDLDKTNPICINCLSKCKHNIRKTLCYDCGGGSFCIHNIRKSVCYDCGGGSICEHLKRKINCKLCKGTNICKHNKHKRLCVDCSPNNFCNHKKMNCAICDPINNIIERERNIIRSSIYRKENRTSIYLGCSRDELYNHITKQMTSYMTFNNIHIDHIKPISKFNLNNEKQRKICFHYTNLQPLFINDNLKKSNKWTEQDEINWKNNIINKALL